MYLVVDNTRQQIFFFAVNFLHHYCWLDIAADFFYPVIFNQHISNNDLSFIDYGNIFNQVILHNLNRNR